MHEHLGHNGSEEVTVYGNWHGHTHVVYFLLERPVDQTVKTSFPDGSARNKSRKMYFRNAFFAILFMARNQNEGQDHNKNVA